MELKVLLLDKGIKPSQKPVLLSSMLSENPQWVETLVEIAKESKDAEKGHCIEALEHLTLNHPELATESCFSLAVASLGSKAPRVRWESGRLIANIAATFPHRVAEAIPGLLNNTEHTGTVVRWSSAMALTAILKLKLPVNKTLIPAVQSTIEKEEKNSIRKIYQAAMKKLS